MSRSATGTIHKKALRIPMTGASDNLEVAEYIIYAADGYSAVDTEYNFNNAYEVGRLTGLAGIQCKAATGHGDAGIGDDDEEVRGHYHPEHIYFFRFYEWEIGRYYAFWIRAVDTAGNVEPLNAAGVNSLGKPLSLFGPMQDPDVNVAEFTAVSGITASNVDQSQGTLGGVPLAGLAINLEWDDLKNMPIAEFPKASHDAFGSAESITFGKARDIKRYGIWMFVSDALDSPEFSYPGPTPQTGGAWYHIGYTIANSFQYSCPAGRAVAFWVGLETEATESTVTAPQFKDS